MLVMLQTRFACGSIAAAGTLGQIIPPSIVLILLGDVISNSYQKAQLELGVASPEAISVGDLFAGALIPGLMLVGLYIAYQILVAIFDGKRTPAIPAAELGPRREVFAAAMKTLPAPLLLIIAVLGSILAGIATPTEAASVGAIGALLIAGSRLAPKKGILAGRFAVFASAAAIIGLLTLTAFFACGSAASRRPGVDESQPCVATFAPAVMKGEAILSLRSDRSWC